MKLEGTYSFNAPQEIVWAALMDTQILQSIMPGCEKLEQVGENSYESVMKIKVGPVQGKFSGTIALSEINEPNSYHLSVQGRGAPGHLTGEADVRLETKGDETILHYTGEAKVGGKIASVGQRLMTTTAKSLTQQSLKELDKHVQAQLPATEPEIPAETSTTPAPHRPQVPPPSTTPPPPPSQIEFAKGVAQNMVDDIVPPENRTMVLAAVGGSIGFILLTWWLARRSDKPGQAFNSISGQFADIRQNQIRPIVAEMSYQLAALDEHQVRPFINSIATQLAELDTQQVQPFIEELAQQISDLSENKLRPLMNELSDQMVTMSQQSSEHGLNSVKAGLTVSGLLAGIAGFVWWFLKSR